MTMVPGRDRKPGKGSRITIPAPAPAPPSYPTLVAGTITQGVHTSSQLNATATAPSGGSGSFAYQWRAGGSPISGATSLTLAWSGRSASTSYSVDLVATDTVTGLSVTYAAVSMSTTAGAGGSTPLFADSFDTGSRAAAANGVRWVNTGSSRISSALAYDGSHSLTFPYPGNAVGEDSSVEEMFEFEFPHLREVWIRYQFYLPSNFYHRAGSVAAPQTNNKFLRLWGDYDNYGNNDPKCGLSFDRYGEGFSDLYLQWGDGNSEILAEGAPEGMHFRPFFGADMRGQWHDVLLHPRLSSAPGVADGVFEVWFNGVHRTTGPIVWWGTRPDNYFRVGYFMGWSNSGYTDPTTFAIDQVRYYTSDPR